MGVAIRWRGGQKSRTSREPHLCRRWMQPLGLPQVSCGWAPHSAGVRALGMKGRTECESGFAWCLSFCPAQHLSWLEVKLRRVPGTTKWWLTTRALSNLLEPRSIGLPDRLTTGRNSEMPRNGTTQRAGRMVTPDAAARDGAGDRAAAVRDNLPGLRGEDWCHARQ